MAGCPDRVDCKGRVRVTSGSRVTVTDATLGIQWHVLAMYGPSFFTGSLISLNQFFQVDFLDFGSNA